MFRLITEDYIFSYSLQVSPPRVHVRVQPKRIKMYVLFNVIRTSRAPNPGQKLGR